MSKVDIWLPQANTYVCWKGNWGTRKGKGDRQARPRKAKGKLGSKEMGGGCSGAWKRKRGVSGEQSCMSKLLWFICMKYI